MIRIGLCDDNKLYTDALEKILYNISKKEDIQLEIKSFHSGESLISFCERHGDYFDILFLDILMDGYNGIKTAEAIRKLTLDVFIVFVTSSKDYALDGYSVNAHSYILKPFSPEDIRSIFLTIHKKISFKLSNTIYIKNNQDIFTLNLNNIVYFESNLRKITAYMIDGTSLTFYNKLSKLEEEISSSMFVRSHRSFLVNVMFIKNIVGLDIMTINNKIIPISKKYLNSTRDNFTYYIETKLTRKDD